MNTTSESSDSNYSGNNYRGSKDGMNAYGRPDYSHDDSSWPDPNASQQGGTSQGGTDGYVARRSPMLAIVGVLALGVAGWGLLGGPTLPDASVTAWVLVAVGLVVGLLLILSGAISSRKS